MDVFKTHVGEGKVLMINEENFYLATRERKPYVVDSGGVKSFYAVCPECDNPIQLIGLLRRQQDSLPHRPYGRHIGHDVPGVAVYDEDAYMFCPLSRNHSDPGNTRRTPTDKAGRELYALMRDQFDRYVYIWEKTTGLHVGRGYARELLSMWRADEGWRYYRASYFNQSFMLFYAAPAQNLMGRYLLVDGPLHCYLKKLRIKSIRFTPTRMDGYVRVDRAEGHGFVDLSFLIHDQSPVMRGEHCVETYRLSVCLGDVRFEPDLKLVLDTGFLDSLMATDDSHRNRTLLDMAADVLD